MKHILRRTVTRHAKGSVKLVMVPAIVLGSGLVISPIWSGDGDPSKFRISKTHASIFPKQSFYFSRHPGRALDRNGEDRKGLVLYQRGEHGLTHID